MGLALLICGEARETVLGGLTLRKASAHYKEDFRYVFEKAFEGLVFDRMDGSEDCFGKLTSDGECQKLAVQHLLDKVYKSLKGKKDERI